MCRRRRRCCGVGVRNKCDVGVNMQIIIINNAAMHAIAAAAVLAMLFVCAAMRNKIITLAAMRQWAQMSSAMLLLQYAAAMRCVALRARARCGARRRNMVGRSNGKWVGAGDGCAMTNA